MVESQYWVWPAKEIAELQTETLSAPAPGEILVRTRYTGVSPGTEMALYMMTHVGFADPENTYAKYPHRGGYLNIGVIEAAGADVAEQWQVGTWVFSSAGHCQYSLARPGDRWKRCLQLPEGLHNPESCFLGLARVAYTAIYVAPPALGERVAVFGAGLVGNFAAQLYAASGAEVLVVERDAFRREIAKRCSLRTVSSTGEIKEHFGADPQIVVEATGVPALCVEAMERVAQVGRVVILSSPRGEAPVNFYRHIHSKIIRVIGAHAKALDDSPESMDLIVGLVSSGKLKLVPCLTHIESWRDAPKVWNAYARGAKNRLGTVFDWGK